MNTSVSFKCIHCNQEIEAAQELSGKEKTCPGCSKAIVIPKVESKNTHDALLEKFPNLKNRSKKELKSALNFLKGYTKIYCEISPSESDYMHIASLAFKNGVGPAIVKRYENVTFTYSMDSSHHDNNKLNKILFSNKKLNKQLNEVIVGAGVKMKKKSLFALFG